MIKRILAVLLALMLILSLAACGENKPAEEKTAEKAEPAAPAVTVPEKQPEEKPEEKQEVKDAPLEAGTYELDFDAAMENDAMPSTDFVFLDLFPEGVGVFSLVSINMQTFNGVSWDDHSLSIEGKPVEYTYDGEKLSFKYDGDSYYFIQGTSSDAALGKAFGDDFTGTYYGDNGMTAEFRSDGRGTLSDDSGEKEFFWGNTQLSTSFVIVDGVLTGLEWKNRYGEFTWNDNLELITYYTVIFAPDGVNKEAFSTLQSGGTGGSSRGDDLELYKAPGEGDFYAGVSLDNIADASQWFTADSENSMTIYKGDYSDPSAVLVIYGSENDESVGYGEVFLEALVSAGVDNLVEDNENMLDSTPEYVDMNGGNKACRTTCLYEEDGVSYIGYAWAWIVGNNAYYMLGLAYYDSGDDAEMSKIADEILDTFMTAQEYLDAGNTAP